MVLGIYGAGGLGREVLDLAEQINQDKHSWEKIVFIDDAQKQVMINEIPVYDFATFCKEFYECGAEVTIAIGEPSIRELLSSKVKDKGLKLAILIHPTVHIPKDTKIGMGSVICVGSFISCNVNISENVYIQPHVNVGHDCVINENAVISGFANIAGGCSIDKRTYIGLSVCMKEKIAIGADTIIGMGSVVVKDIPENVIALGNPARPMKNNDEKRVFK